MFPTITLHEKREIPLLAGHPWVFSNAINTKKAPHHPSSCQGGGGLSEAKAGGGLEATTPGSIVKITSSNNTFLGLGTYNPQNSIAIRVISKQDLAVIDTAFFINSLQTLNTRKQSLIPPNTSGYRVCHADADGLPGLILDRYDSTLVFQIHTLGMEQFRPQIIEAINTVFNPTAIIERSDVQARKQENLTPLEPKVHKGTITSPVPFTENGMIFLADVLHGQKTGFFLDQRSTRQAVRNLSNNKTVLNLFGYSGAFTVAALHGGASEVRTVDVSQAALDLAQQNLSLNNLTVNPSHLVKADVFDYLNQKNPAPDLIICDPPAFAKSKNKHLEAMKAYTSLNKSCLEKLQTGGILITSSCSGRITPEDFRSILRIAAGRARKDIQLLSFLEQAQDHTQKLSFPEGSYLKTAILQVL